MQKFGKGLIRYVDSVYTAWIMIAYSVCELISPNPTNFEILVAVSTIMLFAPNIYQYHIKGSIDEFGNVIDDQSK